MIGFYNKYHIKLGHSTSYYPWGNGLADFSNKSLANIIKKLLLENKKSCHKKIINALWENKVTFKKSIGMSPFQTVYGTDVVLPTSFGIPMLKLLQEDQVETNDMQRRISQTIQLQQPREEVYHKTQVTQENIKRIYDRRTKAYDFQLNDLLLKWDSRNEYKGKHGKFDNLWKGIFKIEAFRGNNAFPLINLNDEELPGELVNGRHLKHYFPS